MHKWIQIGNFTYACPINRPPQHEAARQAHFSISTNGIESPKTACKLSLKHGAGTGPNRPRGCMRKNIGLTVGENQNDILLVIVHLSHWLLSWFFGEDPSKFHSNPSAGPFHLAIPLRSTTDCPKDSPGKPSQGWWLGFLNLFYAACFACTP